MLAIEDSSGDLVMGHKQVAQVAVDFFSSSLGTAQRLPPFDFNSINCTTISPTQAVSLEAPVSNDLIFATLKGMKGNKAPGPDGFTAEFFVATWEIVGDTFCAAVRSFFNTTSMHKAVNATSIALIPKVPTPSSMADFRPISLCSILYKCIAKIIAARLKTVVPGLVDISQSAFIPGRSISDNILMAQELFRGYKRDSGLPKCGLKLDLRKAFDSIDWGFIMEALHKLNFPWKFMNWIYACISTATFSVKVNGALCGFFPGKKGLRQGDPISPYLFSIAMNVLSCILAVTPSHFKFHWKCKDLKLTHLFYADDVLLFSNGDKNSVSHLMDCVSKFSASSGLHPSIAKSTVFFGNCTSRFIRWFDRIYGIAHGQLPVKFLGVPLISSMLSHNDCIPLLDKVTARISSWTALLLSFAGRVQLIRSVIFAIQAYWTKHFLLLAQCIESFSHFVCGFFGKEILIQKGEQRLAGTGCVLLLRKVDWE